MAPNSVSTELHHPVEQVEPEKEKPKAQIVWFNVMLFVYLHVSALYGVYLGYTSAFLGTTIFALLYGYSGGLGITAGSHRLWAHRSYKARLPLRVFLSICTTIAGQNDIHEWVRDHRVHHKYTETNGDPHNIKRGFFFAHMGWLMAKKHDDVKTKGKNIELEDLLKDGVVRFNRMFYMPMNLVFGFILPTMIPVYGWGESHWNAFFVACMSRYCVSLHMTWLVNSAAHMFGDQPFDKYLEARENRFVSTIGLGEGWHNYHHAFPWDYATSELGYTLNFTKIFIDLMAVLGLAYDLKSASKDIVLHRKLKTGDGTRMYEKATTKIQ